MKHDTSEWDIVDTIERPLAKVGKARSLIITTVLLMVAAAYAAGPGATQILSVKANPTPPNVSPQVNPPNVAVDYAAVHRLLSLPIPNIDDPPIILAYHNIDDRSSSRYTVTPENFAAQMALLRQAGYRTITPRQLLGWLAGKPLPRRSILLTFDDGASGTWRHADRILAQNGFRATMFVITGSVRESVGYYLTWAELHRMVASNGWSLEAHSDRGHRYVPIEGGRQGPFFTNRAWLSHKDRLETMEEYRDRITDDLVANRTAFKTHGLPTPTMFAYPFSAATEPTNDSSAPPILRRLVRSLFRVSMRNEYGAGVIRPDQVVRRELSRIEVLGSTSIQGFVRRLVAASQVPVTAVRRPLEQPSAWVDMKGRPMPQGFSGDSLTMAPPVNHWFSTSYLPERSAFWDDYRASVRIQGFNDDHTGTEGGLRIMAGSPNQVQISLSSQWISIRQGQGKKAKVLIEGPLNSLQGHNVVAEVSKGRLRVHVDGILRYRKALRNVIGTSLAGGIALTTARRDSDSPALEFIGLRISPA
jgi:biofilm PGA synthesis lipoprotein PgaB